MALFGTTGWQNIKACRDDIEKEIIEVADILCLKVPIANVATDPSIASTRLSIIRRAASSARTALKNFKSSLSKGAAQDLRDVPIALEAGDPIKWRLLTQALEDRITGYRPEDIVLKRIIGILGPNALLKDRISNLEKDIGALAKRISNAFQLMGHGKEPKERGEVDTAENTTSFRYVAMQLHRLIGNPTGHERDEVAWLLGLDFPTHATGGDVAVAQVVQNCSISFLATKSLPTGEGHLIREINMRRLRGIEAVDDTEVSDLTIAVSELYSKEDWTISIPGQLQNLRYQLDLTDQAPDLLTKDWRILLHACSTRTDVRKAMELERANLALGLTLWFILLWETDWFSHVCSCAFRCALFSLDADDLRAGDAGIPLPGCRQKHVYTTSQPTMPRHTNIPVITEGEFCDANNTTTILPPSCRGRAELKHRLYHFGILLAELALATPIHLSSDLDQYPRSSAPGKPIGQFRRIRQIRNHDSIPHQLKEAIDFCLDNSVEEQWSTETKGLAADRLHDFLEGVIKPVKQYHDVVQKNFKYSKEFTELVREFQDQSFATSSANRDTERTPETGQGLGTG